MTQLSRRRFLTGLLAAPALVRASSLEFVPRNRVLLLDKPSFTLREWVNATGDEAVKKLVAMFETSNDILDGLRSSNWRTLS